MDKTSSLNSCERKHSFTLTDPAVGEVICMDCGAVVSDISMEKHPEWGIFVKNELVSRCGAGIPNMAIHDQGLATKIGRDDKDHRPNKSRIDCSMCLHCM